MTAPEIPRTRVLAATLAVPLLAWWLALWPGGWSVDSLDSWGQIQTGHWTNHHPVPFTALVWLTSLGGHTPATVPLVDALLVAGALAVLVGSLLRAFGGNRAPLYAALALCTLPLIGPLAAVVWKDIPELAFLLLLQGVLLTMQRRAEGHAAPWLLAIAGISLAVALLRWNGAGTVIVAALIAAVGLSGGLRWRAPVVMVLSGVAGFAFLLAVPTFTSVPKLSAADTQMEQLADLAGIAHGQPELLTARDRAALEQVAPVAAWARQGGNCTNPSILRYHLFARRDLDASVDRAAGDLSRTWWSLVRRHPTAVASQRVCRAKLAWLPVDDAHGLHTTWTGVTPNTYGIHPGGWSPLRRAAAAAADAADSAPVHALAWRPVLWLLALVALLCATWRRTQERRLLLLVLAVPLGTVASYVVAPGAQSARYTYPAVIICQLVLAGRAAQWVTARRARRTLASDT